MTEYKINLDEKTFSYIPFTDEIEIGVPNLNNLTDNEISEYISDCFIHEIIHERLYKLFNKVVSKLFDGIDYIFRNEELHKKVFFGDSRITYKTYIKKYGFEKFLKGYGLNKQDITDANVLCNTRNDPYEWVEIFGVPKHREIKNIEPDDIIRIYPNHVIIKIEVV